MKISEVAIIGSGFAGLGMAIRLKQSDIEDFVLFERGHDVGGVWRDNTYPGCACDVESHLYSFSFAPNPNWTRMFSTQSEIWEYTQALAKKYDLYSRIRFDHEVLSLKWEVAADSQPGLWRIETSKGVFHARKIISGTGAFSEPLFPQMDGLEDFKGQVFHSSKWPDSHKNPIALGGKRVAVIGTGASAIQFIPEIQPHVGKLLVFQRSAPWVLPKIDRPISEKERKKFQKLPLLQLLWRLWFYLQREFYGITFRRSKWFEFARGMALHHMRKAVKDSGLRAKLIPNYTIGCKRILLSNNYYPALAQDNVDVVTEKIQSIREHSIVTDNGVERLVDVIILGTGFKVTDFVLSDRIFGRSGASMTEQWRGSPRAFLGTMCTDFPNFFFLLGPNTGLGHSSVVLMIEAQIKLVLDAILYMKKANVKELEPKNRVQIQYNSELDFYSKKTVWTQGGCKSWYLDKNDRNSTIWPSSIGAFRRRLKFRVSDFVVNAPTSEAN